MTLNRKSLITSNPACNNDSPIFERRIEESLLTKNLLAEKVNFSVSYINKLMKHGKIPYLKNGRSVRFKYSDVVAALEKGSAV